MTYDEALAFWYGRVNFERSPPEPGDFKLDRMRALLHLLGDPHEKLRSVHVAGSKGKGSTCAMLASVLRHAGYRTGLFTSPHLTDVRERIEIDGAIITRDDLVGRMIEVKSAVEKLEARGEPVTFFEVGTALGLLHFVHERSDIAVIEVGLGGRFDSTNVITPLVSVITSISLDHTQVLGETVEQIAFEKAGIIKPGVPVVSGVTEIGPRRVIEQIAAERSADFISLGADFHFAIGYPLACGRPVPDFRPSAVEYRSAGRALPLNLYPGLLGDHQAANASIAVAVTDRLGRLGFPCSDKDVDAGIRLVRWPARQEMMGVCPKVILDCAHNVASAEALANTLRRSHLPRDRRLIFAVSTDKDVAGIFRVLAPHFGQFYLTRYLGSSRAVPPERLAEILPANLDRVVYQTPAEAWRAACADATPQTLVVIAGSVFLAGELRPILVEASGA